MPARVKQQPGDRFGRWVLIEPGERNKHKQATWLCRCDCGTERVVVLGSLRQNISRGCGCDKLGNVTHGLSGTSEHRTWKAMRARCYNANSDDYPDYGGRGIQVCERWKASFVDFLADMGPRPVGMSIHRVENDGNYEPSNCVWATSAQQARAKRTSKLVTWDGRTQCLADWADELGVSWDLLRDRLDVMNWPVERAFTEPAGVVVGSQHHSAKLTESDVLAIREDSRKNAAIAASYGVTSALIGMVKRRRIWKHI